MVVALRDVTMGNPWVSIMIGYSVTHSHMSPFVAGFPQSIKGRTAHAVRSLSPPNGPALATQSAFPQVRGLGASLELVPGVACPPVTPGDRQPAGYSP
jgi:hypothetical protein